MRGVCVYTAIGTACLGQSDIQDRASFLMRALSLQGYKGTICNLPRKLKHCDFRATQWLRREQKQPDSLGKNWSGFCKRKRLSRFLKRTGGLVENWSFRVLTLFVEQEISPSSSGVFSGGKCIFWQIQQKITSVKTGSRDREQQNSSWIDAVPPRGSSMPSLVCVDVWHFNRLQWFRKLRVEEGQSSHPGKKSAGKEYV